MIIKAWIPAISGRGNKSASIRPKDSATRHQTMYRKKENPHITINHPSAEIGDLHTGVSLVVYSICLDLLFVSFHIKKMATYRRPGVFARVDE